jgi:dTDP-4-amino-4,6-dideoxygalactose transaminase
MRRLREHGMSVSAAERHAGRQPVIERYLEVGYNYRMTDIQAAIGLVQLGRLGDIIARRRELAQRYQQLLGQIPGVKMIADPAYGTTNFQSFWVALPEDFPMTRNELLQHLASAGISARRGIMAAHLEPAYADYPHVDLPATERLSSSSVILPLFHQLTRDEQDQVISAMFDAAGLPSPAARETAASAAG